MKKIICKVEYNTETAQLLNKVTCGEFGDPAGYEESLYLTEDGKYLFDFKKLHRWIDLALDCGYEYFEIPHYAH